MGCALDHALEAPDNGESDHRYIAIVQLSDGILRSQERVVDRRRNASAEVGVSSILLTGDDGLPVHAPLLI